MKTKAIILALAATLSATNGLTAEFTDWTNVDTAAGIASGVLDGVPVTLTGGLTDFYATNGSFTGFDSPLFSPRLAASDALEVRGLSPAASYVVTFGAPIRDPIFHLGSVASVLSFDTTNIVRRSGDITVSNNTVAGYYSDPRGTPPLSDANGSVQFIGDFTRIAFTALYDLSELDGIAIQIGGTDPRLLRVSIRVSQVEVCWPSRIGTNYMVQYRSDLTTNAWAPLVQCIPGNGVTNCIYDAVPVGEPRRFYRVFIMDSINCPGL